ncbi:MAG TPA: ABC transporter substrate binding protein [Deltaproteobacteria bacterium]|nr:ABC transporter substrate binding protein [Deltaproteobacteria bacterium]
MKRSLFVALVLLFCALPCQGAGYRIEILQVGNVDAFDMAVTAAKAELAKNGLIEGQNLSINRTVIDADLDAGIWEKAKIFLKIKNQAARIASAKPDLVITVGTPATKYSKEKIIGAGIPLIFTGVAIPELVGCKSKTQAGPGFTGATIYMDPKDVLQLAKLALPNLKVMGVVHSDDENAAAYVQEAKTKASQLGITIHSRQVSKSDKLTPAAKELVAKGIDAFFIPIDVYYALRDYEPTKELRAFTHNSKIPGIASVLGGHKGSRGAVLYIAPDFRIVGGLTGKQAVKILKEGVKPETLPVARQEKLDIHVDLVELKALDLQLPMQVLQLAKPLD